MRAPFVVLAGAAWGALIYGCTGPPVPVSEREVADYRKPSATGAPSPAGSPSSVGAPSTPQVEPKPQVGRAPSQPVRVAPPKPTPAPTEGGEAGDWRPETYTIKRGDTLYSIALDHGLDYKELAAWNQLPDANMIKVGQQLKLRPPPGWRTEAAAGDEVIARPLATSPPPEPQPLEPPAAPKTAPRGNKVPYSDEAFALLMRDPNTGPGPEARPATLEAGPQPKGQIAEENKAVPEAKPPATLEPAGKPTPPVKAEPTAVKPALRLDDTLSEQPLQWSWPATGKLVHPFNQGSNPKGVAIRGTAGQAVFATAAGKVVYSGSGLRGYGKLIIIKHNSTYLSVYAHNRELLVKEGERVSRNQKIAEMGSDSADGVALHFEIRRLGKPVDPLKFLPAEGV